MGTIRRRATIQPSNERAVLKRLREDQGLTQEDLAAKLHVHVNTVINLENRKGKTSVQLLLAWRRLLRLSSRQWEEALKEFEPEADQYGAAASPAAPTDFCWVLNPAKDMIDRLSCLRVFYEQSKQGSHLLEKSGKRPRQRSLRRLFAFRSPDLIPVIMGIHGEQSSGGGILSFTDQEGTYLLHALLDSLKIPNRHLSTLENRDALPLFHASSMVLPGGPQSNSYTKDVNEKLSIESWFSGFFFHNDNPNNQWGWLVRHRIHNDVQITMADTSVMDAPTVDGRPPYRPLEDGQEQDYGVLYIGPHPHNFQHWLVMIAGLRGMGTYAAAKALQDSNTMELIAQQLRTKRHYISGLVRYRFLDQDGRRFHGFNSSICLTTGMVPS